MRNLSKIVFVVFAATSLAACSLTSPSTTTQPAQESLTMLEADPMQTCNLLSTSKKILLNSPCENITLTSKTFEISGKIINNEELVNLDVMQNGSVVYTQEIFPVPSDAAGSYKLIKETVTLPDSVVGSITLEINQSGEKVSVGLVV